MRTTFAITATATLAALTLTACGTTTEGTATAEQVITPEPVEAATTFTAPTGEWNPPQDPIVDGNDELFIQLLDTEGIYYSTEQTAVEAAQGSCDAFDAGATFLDVASIAINDGGMTPEDAGFFIGASVAVYCIENQPVVDAFASQFGGN